MTFRRHHIKPRRVYMAVDPCKAFPTMADYGTWAHAFCQEHGIDESAPDVEARIGARVEELAGSAAVVPDHPWVEVQRIHRVGDSRYSPELLKAASAIHEGGGMAASAIITTVGAIIAAGGDWSLYPEPLDKPKLWPLWETLGWTERVGLFAQLHLKDASDLYELSHTGMEAVEPSELGNFLRASRCSSTSTTTTAAPPAPSTPSSSGVAPA